MNYLNVLEKAICLSPEVPVSQKDRIIAYYEKAGPDYAAWSRKYNMHFGYYRKGMNPFDRESMLEMMNRQVFERLGLNPHVPATLADFGCGLGATLRYAAAHYPQMLLKGVTLVPWQVKQARKLNSGAAVYSDIEIIEGNYCRTRFESGSLDAVIAIESSCYASGADKADLLREIYRVLKPGGKFLICDGFRKHGRPLKGLLGSVYRQLCRSWALTELGNIVEVKKSLGHLGFGELHAEEISRKVAPSVAHVPFTVVSFLMKELFCGKSSMSRERWNNLISPLLTMILGLAGRHFGYYMVSGRKEAGSSSVQ